MNLKKTAYFFIVIIATVVILITGQSLIIPFVLSLILWFIVKEIRHFIDGVGFIKKRIPTWFKSLIVFGLLFVLLSFFSQLILTNINSLAKSYPKYYSNLDALISTVNQNLNINIIELTKSQSRDIDFGNLLKNLFKSIADTLSNGVMILFYTLFIFLEESFFDTKMKAVFTKSNQYNDVNKILERIGSSVSDYLKIKVLTSSITGVLSYLALLFIGIDSPVFWAFLIFILNFIPTIGSIIATVFPTLFCLLQFGEISPAALTLFIVGGIQVVIGNIIEPKLMGNSMNLSPLVIILALSFWGSIWGIIGMLLSVPITVIIVIIMSQFESSKPVAIMMSQKGKVASSV